MGGKRRWFQIHLSTAILMMLVAAVLVWANCRIDDPASVEPPGSNYDSLGFSGQGPHPAEFGWPMPCLFVTTWPIGWGRSYSWNPWSGIANGMTALAILAATAFGCEFWIRRRERVVQLKGES